MPFVPSLNNHMIIKAWFPIAKKRPDWFEYEKGYGRHYGQDLVIQGIAVACTYKAN